MSELLNYLKNNWLLILLVLLLALSCFLIHKAYMNEKALRERLEQVEYTDSNNVFNREYYDEQISALKKKNKALYDSIKGYKDEVSYLLQFKYEKQYDTGKVDTHPKDSTNTVVNDSTIEYQYANEINDTMNYSLTVASKAEPEWYRLKVRLTDKFTIINRDADNGQNHISIGTDNHGTITDVTTFKRDEKRGFFERFAFGPSISVGYDPIGKRLSPTIGIGLTYDLLEGYKGKKKK